MQAGRPRDPGCGRPFLVRGTPAKIYERGVKERTVVTEWDSLEKAIAAHDSPAYQEAVRALGDGVERDLRISKALIMAEPRWAIRTTRS